MRSTIFPRLYSRATRALIRRWSAHLPVAGSGWPALHAELDLWRGPPARFWWRDDDAICETPELRHLLAVRDRQAIPLAIAVIPARASANFGSVLSGWPCVDIFAHGWDHQNHNRPGRLSAELAPGRKAGEVRLELTQGRTRLEDMFGEQFKPVLVPPYNYLSPHLVEPVREAGFSFVSIDRDFAGFSVPSQNVHIDVIDWRRKQAATPIEIVRSAVAALRLRRYGLVDADAPIGLITHHLVHDASVWAVTETLLDRLKEHPAVAFPAMHEVFR